jgi:hypothetical protein
MYYEEERGGGGAFIAGLALGAILGAGLTMLLAPQSGRSTRRQLRKAMGETRIGSASFGDVSDELRSALKRRRRRRA